MKKPNDITFYADGKPYMTQLDYDNWFGWVGIIPFGQILMRKNGVCMSKETFEDIIGKVKLKTEYDKLYELSVYLGEHDETL